MKLSALLPALTITLAGLSSAHAAPKVKKVATTGRVEIKAESAAKGTAAKSKPVGFRSLQKKATRPDTIHGLFIPNSLVNVRLAKGDSARLAKEIMIQVNAYKAKGKPGAKTKRRTSDVIYGLGIPAELADLGLENMDSAQVAREIMIQVEAYKAAQKTPAKQKISDITHGLGVPAELNGLGLEKRDSAAVAREIMLQVDAYN